MVLRTAVEPDASTFIPVVKPARRRFGFTRDAWWGYFFIAPAFIFVIGFTLIPILGSFGISLTDWDMISPAQFVGLKNYEKAFSDALAQRTFTNTFLYTFISVPIGMILALLLALLLNQKLRGLSFFRTAFYLPVISSTVAISVIFTWVLDPSYGLLNRALGLIGIDPIPWLISPQYAMPAVILVTIWRSLGFNMIIFLAALQEIPADLHDAAKIDGANARQKFLRVVLPLISPSLFFVTITSIINSFQSFDLVYNMTQGGPARSTYLIGYYIWEQAFKYLNMGYGASLAFILFFMILIVTLVQWTTRRFWVYGES
jgi:multiple sugar transport system permease protein